MSDADDGELVTPRPEAPTENGPEVELSRQDEDTRTLPERIKVPSVVTGQHEDAQTPAQSDAGDGGTEGEENKSPMKGSHETEGKTSRACPPPRSRCRSRSRDMRQCKKHFREMIGKYENRNDELEQRETDLRQRLEMLECSMPAVMVWNIWRMAQGAPVSHLRDVVEKQFLGPATGSPECPSSPSQHWDCRVREVEAERKQARHRAEQARQVLAAKGEALEVQKQQIEEARKLQEERKLQIAGLEEEVKRLRNELKNAQGDENFCQTGECGEIRCRDAWLRGAASVSSVHSTDLECLARLQDLAEAELCMKRQIADLERRECAYMRTLQQADEMWAKMEGDNASSLGELREQLESKIAANQQLADRIVELEDEIEKLKMQLSKASAALDGYTQKTFADIGLGDVDVSTKEKIEQTDEEVVKFAANEAKDDEKESKFPEKTAMGSEQVGEMPQWQDKDTKNTAIAAIVNDAEFYYEKIDPSREISTAKESVQVKPEIDEIVNQSIEESNLEKGISAEEQTQFTDGKATAASELSTKYLAEEDHMNAGARPTQAEETKRVAAAEKSRTFEDKGSLVHLLKPPTEDRNTEVSITENSVDRNEPLRVTPDKAPGGTVGATPAVVSETIPVTENVGDSPPEPVAEPFGKAPSVAFFEKISGIPLPKSPIQSVTESSIEVTVKPSPQPEIESTVKAVASLVLVSATETVAAPATELKAPEEADESSVPNAKVEIRLPSDTFALPIGTLMAWHNVAACVQQLISICPQCSSSSTEIGNMLTEMRKVLRKEAPDLAKIECPQNTGGAKNSVAVPHKKGPCICKPKTCPLGSTPAAAPPQSSVRVQTVVDGQSQTLVSAKISTRGIQSPRSSRGLTRTRDEVKFASIEEGPEPDRRTPRARSISGARDEATVTVGDIASQTEAIRRVPSGTENSEKTCVCPKGVCPKKNPIPSREECKPGNSLDGGRRSQNKEYKSTADAILAPAIRVLPCNESDAGPPVTRAKINNDTSSESGGKFACCLCGSPKSPVASWKTTSALSPTKSFLQNRVKLTSDTSDEDFLCCTCKSKAATSVVTKTSVSGKPSEKSMHSGRVSNRAKPLSGMFKTSCSRDVCCPCSDEPKTHVIARPSSDGSEVLKSRLRPETKDVCCLAKISRDKVLRTEGNRRKDKDPIKAATSGVSYSSSAQMPATSSTYKSPAKNESSDSNVCCSSIEQVMGMTKRKGKGTRCACTSQESKDQKEECVCEQNGSPQSIGPLKAERTDSRESCLCPSPKIAR